MITHGIRALWVYWLVMIIGFIASFAIFTVTIQQWNANLWISVTFAISVAGLLMVMDGGRDIRKQSRFRISHHLILGLGISSLFGLFIYFSVHLLGFFIFYLQYFCWAFLFMASIYYAILIKKLANLR